MALRIDERRVRRIAGIALFSVMGPMRRSARGARSCSRAAPMRDEDRAMMEKEFFK
jgi:hypothetical protein